MVSSAFPSRPFNLRDNVWFMQTDVANNRSLVGWELWIDKTAYSPTWSADGAAARWMRLNGGYVHEYYGTGFDFRNGNNFLLANGTAWIPHNADGTKQLLIEASATFALLGATSLSVTIPLPTIPRASVVTFSNPDYEHLIIGSPVTVTTNRASSNFTHDIDWYFGTKTGRALTGVADSAQWTVPTSFLTEIPNADTGVGKLRAHTYSGGTLLGWTESSFRVYAAATVIPTWTSVSASEAVSNVTTKVGAYVQNYSKLNWSIVGAAGVSGSTITAQSFKVGASGTVLSGASGTTPVITLSGTVPITYTVTDSRNRKKTLTQNINVLPYSAPTITTAIIKRALANGTVDEDGTYLRVTLNASVRSLINGTQKNAMTIRVYTKPRTSSTWTLKQTINPTGISYNSSFTVTGPFAIDTPYDIRIDVVDIFTTSSSTSVVPVSAVFMHWGTGLGIGKFWENGMVDVNGDVYVSGDLHLPSGLNNLGSIEGAAAPNTFPIGVSFGTVGTAGFPVTLGTVMTVRQSDFRQSQTVWERAGTLRMFYRASNGATTWEPWQEVLTRQNPSAAYAMAAGTANGVASGDVTVTFPTGRFSVAPHLTVTSRTAGAALVPIVNSLSATSFAVRWFNIQPVEQVANTFDWQAVQMTSSAASG